MEIGDYIIWDSNHGYELGVFMGKGNQYYTVLVYLVNFGRWFTISRPVSLNENEVLLFTLNNMRLMVDKYTYNRLTSRKKQLRIEKEEIRLTNTLKTYNII